MADGPKFGLFVRSVEGRVVQRYGTAELIGATRRTLTKAQKLDGESPIEWNDTIVALPVALCRRFDRELREHIRVGDLVEVKREDWEAQCSAEQKRIEEDNRRAADVAKPAAEEAKKGKK